MGLLKWLRDKSALAHGLSAADWLAFFEAWWGLLFFWLVLHWWSYDQLDHGPVGGRLDLLRVERLHQLVLWSSRLHLLPMTCLMQACTLRRMATRRGLQVQVRIGATRTAQGIHAHAWVEVAGQPVGEEGVNERFRSLKAVGE